MQICTQRPVYCPFALALAERSPKKDPTLVTVLAILGTALTLGGTLMAAVGRRLAGYLTSQPMHREGDALFTYIAGAGYLAIVLGIASLCVCSWMYF